MRVCSRAKTLKHPKQRQPTEDGQASLGRMGELAQAMPDADLAEHARQCERIQAREAARVAAIHGLLGFDGEPPEIAVKFGGRLVEERGQKPERRKAAR